MYDAVAAPWGTGGTFPLTQIVLKLSYFFLVDFINFKLKNFKFSLNFSNF